MKVMKIVVVGDGAVGKTSLLMKNSNSRYMDYIPTVTDNYSYQKEWNSKIIDICTWDTGGREVFDKLRPLSYPNTSIFFICFSVLHPDTFENVKLLWIKELRKYCPNTPIILVGTKIDLREDVKKIQNLKDLDGKNPISKEQGEEMAKKIGACAYCETSTFQNIGIEELFDKSIEIYQNPENFVQRNNQQICNLL